MPVNQKTHTLIPHVFRLYFIRCHGMFSDDLNRVFRARNKPPDAIKNRNALECGKLAETAKLAYLVKPGEFEFREYPIPEIDDDQIPIRAVKPRDKLVTCIIPCGKCSACKVRRRGPICVRTAAFTGFFRMTTFI